MFFSNDTRVADTATPNNFTVGSSDPNVGQYGWTKEDRGNYNQLIQYVEECRKAVDRIEEMADYIDGLVVKVEGIGVIYEDIVRIQTALREVEASIEADTTYFKREYADFLEKIEDFDKKYQNFLSKYQESFEAAAAAKAAADAAKLSEDNAKKSADDSAASAKEASDVAEELRKGQVYRGAWNIEENNSYPPKPDTNSVWDITLKEDSIQFIFNGETWYWGDRLLYLKDDDKFSQIESGSTVISVNGKSGAVVLSADDVGALSKTGIAVAAKKLETPRLIAGKPFDGTKDITISYSDVGALGATDSEAGSGALMRVGGARDQEITQALEGIVGGAVISDTPPTNPKAGVTWYNTTDAKTYIWYLDGDGDTQWVDQNPDELVVENMGGVPLMSAMWFSSRDSVEPGYVPADGQLVSKDMYPDAWKRVLNNLVPAIPDETWISNPLRRGSYSTGSSTHFRMPDYNGRSPGSVGAPFMRGDGTGVDVGTIIESQNKAHSHSRGDMNITGSFGSSDANGGFFHNSGHVKPNGAFGAGANQGVHRGRTEPADTGSPPITFDASKSWTGSTSSEGGSEARPLNVTGVWAVKVFDRMIDPSSINVAEVTAELVRVQGELTSAEQKIAASEAKIAASEAKIAELEQWPQTGSNDNGSWIKHKDGTLECIFSQPEITGVNSNHASGSSFYTSGGFKEWTLPTQLSSVGGVSFAFSGYVPSGAANLPTFWAIVRDVNTVGLYCGTSTIQNNATIKDYTIRLFGRWK